MDLVDCGVIRAVIESGPQEIADTTVYTKWSTLRPIERAHARGLKIFGATMTPFEGDRLWTQAGEDTRKAVNEWIRTSKAYDGVFDFDAAVRNPEAPTKLLGKYDPGDHLHLNAAGYEVMANSIDLNRFRAP